MKPEKVFLRAPHNYDVDEASRESALLCSDKSLTKQSFAEECDINAIVRRFGLTGQLPEGVRMPTYGDFENVPDFHSAMGAVRQAQEAFMAMPADVRTRFGNDPGAFVDFCSNPDNLDEARKLGLVASAQAGKGSSTTAPVDNASKATVGAEPSTST